MAGRITDLSGRRFGRLEVLSRGENTKAQKARWHCRCDCGKETLAIGASLLNGHTQSCGCFKDEKTSQRFKKHGHSGYTKTRTYSIWKGMISRCRNPNATSYKWYGALGIDVCERWNSYENFLADMGEAPEGMSLDRQRSSLGYGPDNCVWATDLQQSRNAKSNRKITAFGKTLCASEWAEITGIPAPTIYDRLNRGWTGEKAVSPSIRKKKSA